MFSRTTGNSPRTVAQKPTPLHVPAHYAALALRLRPVSTNDSILVDLQSLQHSIKPWLAQYDKEINSILHGDMEATALSSLPGTSNYQNMPYKMDASLQYTSLGPQSNAMSGPSVNMGLPHLSRGLQNVTGVPTNMIDLSPTMPGVSPATPGRSPNMPEMMPSVTTVSANVTGTPLNFPSMVDMANYQLNSLLNMTNAQCASSNNQALPTQTHYSNDLPNLEDLQATIFEEQCSMSGLLLERADLNSGDLMSLLAERNNDSMKDLKL